MLRANSNSDERKIRLTYLAAQRAGPATKAVKILSLGELESPIDDSDLTDAEDDEETTPEIVGYKIAEKIGTGGQSTVYRAIQESTGKVVAIKLLNGGPVPLARHRRRFRREICALATLSHPNIVGVIDGGRTRNRGFYLAMEFINGPDLDFHLTTLSDSGLIRTFIKIARAVDEAHKAGIVHRDLKPSNIRVDRHGEPKILDFGLAQSSSRSDFSLSLTGDKRIVGSLPWASPEQATGKGDADYSSDVYSLGVMLYAAVAGQHPYPIDGTLDELLNHIVKGHPSPTAKVRGSRSMPRHRELDAIIRKTLSKDRRDRYASAGDLAHDLENLSEGKRVSAPARRLVKPLIIASLISVLCAGGASWKWIRNSEPRRFDLPSVENTVGMKLVRIPAGELLPSPKKIRLSVSAFYISTTEVTRGQFTLVMTGAKTTNADNPVDMVSWDEAVEFCQKLSALDHRHYRLPTIAEWEYACAAGNSDLLQPEELADHAWFSLNGQGKIHSVAKKNPNPFGLFDMRGNAAEWVDGLSTTEPIPSSDFAAISDRTAMGGSVFSPSTGAQFSSAASFSRQTHRPALGFRVVADPH